MSNTWFTADLHLAHRNIIKFTKRPYADLTEMDNALIAHWNDCVSPGDVIWMLGDFTFERDPEKIEWYFSRLNGVKFLIKGNHDHHATTMLRWAGVFDYKALKFGSDVFILCHYHIEAWDRKFHGSVHLHGHIHTLPDGSSTDPNHQVIERRFDVGVDSNDFKPVSLGDIRLRVTSQGEQT